VLWARSPRARALLGLARSVAVAAAPRASLCGCRLRAWSSRPQRSPTGFLNRVSSVRAHAAARAALLRPRGVFVLPRCHARPVPRTAARCARCHCLFLLATDAAAPTARLACRPARFVSLGATVGHCLGLTATLRARHARLFGLISCTLVRDAAPVGVRLVLIHSPRWGVPSLVRPRSELSAATQRSR
jgi:hypothetical protein